jgi:hypothetical protein
MSNDPTTTFYPYDVCLDGGFVSEHLAILDASQAAWDLKRENPDSVVTILISIDPREVAAPSLASPLGEHVDEHGRHYHLWANGWSHGTRSEGAPVDALGIPIAYPTLAAAIAAARHGAAS